MGGCFAILRLRRGRTAASLRTARNDTGISEGVGAPSTNGIANNWQQIRAHLRRHAVQVFVSVSFCLEIYATPDFKNHLEIEERTC